MPWQRQAWLPSGSEKKEFSPLKPNWWCYSSLPRKALGPKDFARQRGLLLEQELLIKELRLIQDHLARLGREVSQIVEQLPGGKNPALHPSDEPSCCCHLLAGYRSHCQF